MVDLSIVFCERSPEYIGLSKFGGEQKPVRFGAVWSFRSGRSFPNDAQGVDRLGTEIPGPGVMSNHQAFAIARRDRARMEPDLSAASMRVEAESEKKGGDLEVVDPLSRDLFLL